MTATVEQTQAELARLIDLAQRGEEVVITKQGEPVAKLTAISTAKPLAQDRATWLAELAALRTRLGTGKIQPTSEQILEEDRG
jgi:prevent-host-death family protein